jgi:hypothetical protein
VVIDLGTRVCRELRIVDALLSHLAFLFRDDIQSCLGKA